MDRLRATKERLEKDVGACGFHAGETILMHSSLKAIGFVEDGADTVIDVLLRQLGRDGTLMVPTFSYSYADRVGTVPFDVKTTPGFCNGAISDRLWKRPDAVRSTHPSHSFAAIGKNAHFLCDDHQPEHAVSCPSPLSRIIALGGRVLFLGCGLQPNVMLHMAESMTHPRYDHLPFNPEWGVDYIIASPKGPLRIHVTEHPGCDNKFSLVTDLLLSAGHGICGNIGMAQTFLFYANDIFEAGRQMIKEQPDILLCSEPDCQACIPRRKYLRRIGAI